MKNKKYILFCLFLLYLAPARQATSQKMKTNTLPSVVQ